jgi:hypothetical protein
VENAVHAAHIFDFSILALSGVERAGLSELVTESLLILSLYHGQKVVEGALLGNFVVVSGDFNEAGVFHGELNALLAFSGARIAEFNAERVVVVFFNLVESLPLSSLLSVLGLFAHFFLLLDELYCDILISFFVFKFDLSFFRLEGEELVGTFLVAINGNNFIFNPGFSAAPILSLDLHLDLRLANGCLDIGLLEAQESRLVIIQNGDSGFGIVSSNSLAGVSVIKLNIEILIRLPFVIINNHNLYFL